MPAPDRHISQIATNTANIAHLQKGYETVSDKIDHLEEKVDALDEKLDQVISRIDANVNQWQGASKLAKFLKEIAPYICGIIAYFAGRMH